MTLPHLQQRILRLCAERPVLRLTVMKQCRLAGSETIDIVDALIELIDEGFLGSSCDFDRLGRERNSSYETTARGAEQLTHDGNRCFP